MKLYNTLTRRIDTLQPLSANNVTIYTCGPTVYDYAHIGHWFTYVRWDTLVRTVRASGLQPKWVMNITDVGHLVSDADDGEDKLEKGARREGKTAWQVAEYYTQDFLACMQLLNINEPDELPRATDHISEQIALIESLEQKNHTYIIDDGVYFDTATFPTYADFAQLDLEEQKTGARVEANPQKHNPSDFALWKFSPQAANRDMEWDSPWGKGFPGWHIECSAMSMKYLGETLDIHTGGIDHVPVHHTNEIAQSESATGKPFANIWLHSNHVMVNGEKISKSLGNGIRLQQIIEKGIPAAAVRLHILESHYRTQSKFSWESLESANNRLLAYYAWADLKHQLAAHTTGKLDESYKLGYKSILSALQSDLNTPEALMHVSSLVTQSETTGVDTHKIQHLLNLLDTMLGLDLSKRPDITHAQKDLIADREQARLDKDWERSDKARDQLKEQGIGVRDTPKGPIWYRI